MIVYRQFQVLSQPYREGFRMKVENMKSAKTGKAVANQFLIMDRGCIWFQSYKSIIGVITPDNILLLDKNKWDYSVTTAKYRNAFVAAYFNSRYASTEGIKGGIKEGKIIMTELNNR